MSEQLHTTLRIGVMSDIHGNLEALKSVLADMEAQKVSRVVNLGDIVGYGPEPEACVNMLRHLRIPSVLGNHEHGLLEAQARGWFNPQARKALDRTRALLSDDSIMYFRTLPRTLEEGGALFVHGCPPGLVSKYLYELNVAELRETFSLFEHPLCFCGHTHELEMITLRPSVGEGGGTSCGDIRRDTLGKGRHALDPRTRHIVNAGAVGQPRDGNNKAKYLVWEPERHRVDVRFVSYDIAQTAARIVEVGLPSVYADRLW